MSEIQSYFKAAVSKHNAEIVSPELTGSEMERIVKYFNAAVSNYNSEIVTPKLTGKEKEEVMKYFNAIKSKKVLKNAVSKHEFSNNNDDDDEPKSPAPVDRLMYNSGLEIKFIPDKKNIEY
ncbi:MAG: hypothetical protein PHN56_01645 [Candidatus Nanoarchaeia archaeon]|nr:hypothetical protein [Candidatus Nanoarchaeia archaeon]